MKRLAKNSENLKKVVESICSPNFSAGKFERNFVSSEVVTLVSSCRTGIGSSVLSLIPSNWDFRVSFEDSVLKLYIFIS